MNISRRKALRVTSGIVAGAILATGMTGCAVTASNSDSNTIRVIAQAGGPGEALKAAAAEYSKTHSQKVTVDLYDYDSVRERTVLGFSSGKASYDVIGADYTWLKQYVDDGNLVPLDDKIKADASAINMKDYVQSYVKAGNIDGKQYGLPWFGAVYMLYYRKDLLQQAGVSVPKTWDEYVTAAKIIREKTGVTGTTLIGKRDDPLLDEYWSVAWSYGADITKDGKSSAVDSPEAVKALDVWKSVLPAAPADALSADWPAAAASFSEGKTAMMINFSDTSDALISDTSKVRDKVGFAALPAGPTGKFTPCLGGWVLGVSSKSKMSQKAFDFIAWATSATQQQAGLEHGGSANRISVLSDPANQAKYPYYAAALENYENAVPLPSARNWVDWEAAMAPPLSAALSGQISTTEAVAQSSKRLDAEIAKDSK